MQKNIYELGTKQRLLKGIKKTVSCVTAFALTLTMMTSDMATIEARAEDPTPLTAEITGWTEGTYEVTEDVSFGEPITVSGNVTLILNDGKILTATKGITVTAGEGNSLTITGGTENTGVLYAGTTDGTDCTAEAGTAGIDGTVTINGGAVTAYGGEGAMGIDGTLTLGSGVTLSTSEDLSEWNESADGTDKARYMKTVYTPPAPHVHSWTYSASGAVITATCTEGCTSNYDEGVTLTISASNATYNGSTHGATLNSTAWTAAGFEVPDIYYAGVGFTTYERSTTAPTNAGTYSASVTVDTDKTATVQFTISRATLTGVSVEQDGTLTYNGTAQTPTVNATATAVNSQAVTFTYSTTVDGAYGEMPSFTNVSECGTVYYKASAPNHNEASGNFTVTMNKADRSAPGAPTLSSKTINSITLATITDGRYRCGEGAWQESATFTGLTMNTEYTFYQYIAGDDNYNDSPSSIGASFSTNNHVHEFSYEASGATITENCANSDGGHSGAAATITIVAPSLTTYGGTGDAEATITGSLSGVANPTIVYKQGDTVLDAAPTGVGTYTANITLSGVALTGGGTGAVTASVEYTIAKRPVTITANAQTITYGESITSRIIDIVATGLLDDDAVASVTLTPSTTDVTDSGSILLSAITITTGVTNVTDNYDINYVPGTLTINQRNITITADNQTVGLNGEISSDKSKALITSGELATDDELVGITLISSSTAAVTTTGTITASNAVIKHGGASGVVVTTNYNITYVDGTLTVTQAVPSLTPPTAKTLNYNGSAQVLINEGVAEGGYLYYSLDGTNYTLDVSEITGTNAGGYTVYYKVTGDANHSDIEATSLTVNIGKMAAPASVEDSQKPVAIANLQYTGAAQALVSEPESLPAGYESVQYALGGGAFGADIPTGTAVGNYSIQVKYFGDSNHEDFVLSTSIAAAIAERDLSDAVTVTYSATSFAYGSGDVTPTVTVTITAGGTELTEGTDYDVEYVGVSPTTYAQSATAPTSPGTYKAVIVFKGNYTGTATAATAYTIERSTEAPTATPKTITYSGTTYDLSNLFDFPVAEVGKTYSIVSDGTTGAGTIEGSTLTITKAGIIKIKVATTATDTVDASEVISTLTVNKGTVTGSISVTGITYGQTLADATITYTPEAAGHLTVEYSVTDSGSWSSTKPVAAGSYSARVTLGGNDLYEAEVVTCTFTIAKAALTVTADNKTKVRDTADPALTYEVTSGLVEGDSAAAVLTGALSRDAGETVGTYAITVGTLAVVGGNYEMTFVPGTFTITKAIHSDVTVGAANAKLVPTVALTGLTMDVKDFITPELAEGTTYSVTAAAGVVVASPLPTVSGSVVTFAVADSSDAATGSITVTVTDPNYEPYAVTIPVKSSVSLNYKTDTAFTNSGVTDNSVSAVTVTGLENYAQTQAGTGEAVEILLAVEKKAADTVDDAVKENILSAASGVFTAIGYSESDLKKAYLTIDVKKFTATDFASINTSGSYDSVIDTVTPVELALNVGTDVAAKKPVVVREHGGTLLLLTELSSRPTGSYQDGKYYVDKTAGIIYVYTRYFSVYSLVYASSAPVTVTFDSAGGSAVAAASVKSGTAVTKPANPTRSGYTFNGWLLGSTEYNFSTPVTSNITLTARWTYVSTGGSTSGGTSNTTTGSGSSGSSNGSSSSGSSSSGSRRSSNSTGTNRGASGAKSSVTSTPVEDYDSFYELESAVEETVPVIPENAEAIETAEKTDKEELVQPVEELMPAYETSKTGKARKQSDILFVGALSIAVILVAAIVVWLLYELKRTLKNFELKSGKSRAF